MKKVKTEWLAFNIRMPEEIIPIYDFLQEELNFLLSDTESRKSLESIDLSAHKGNVWRAMRDLFKNRVAEWDLHNKTWHSYILFENLRREIQSKHEAITIWNALVENDMQINQDLFDNLVSNYKVYATRGTVSNILRSGKMPELPYEATFQLDYTISEKQFFRMSEDNICKIKINKTDWIDYQIILPSSLNKNLTGVIAKPRFIKRKSDGQYIGICSYEYIPEIASGNNILGVDVGQIKLFSATALKKDGTYSDEYIHSKVTEAKLQKLNRMYIAKQNLYDKNNQNEKLNFTSERNRRRIEEYKHISKKIVNLKKDIARNLAKEIVHVAKTQECNEIHIENLSWLASKGGKWNHSEVHQMIAEAAKIAGIKTVKVQAAYSSTQHPITKEIGVKSGRVVKFQSGREIDRDVLASINLAIRNKGKKKENKIIKLRKKHKPSIRTKRRSERKEIQELIKQIKGDGEIVLFSPNVPSANTAGVWSRETRVLPNNSLLKTHKDLSLSICYNY